MERVPTPKDLRGAGAVAQSLAYVAGLAGVIAGGLLYRDGETAFAVVAWVLTFAVGAMLMIAAFLVRAMAAILGHLARLASDVQVLIADRGRAGRVEHERDPWAGYPPH